MSTTDDEQERGTQELTNLIDVIAAETAVDPTPVDPTPDPKIEAEPTAKTTEKAVDKGVAGTVVKEAAGKTAVKKPTKPSKASKPSRPPKKQRQKRKPTLTSKDVVRWFASCGRCSFFLTAYQLIESNVDLETAVSRTKGEWLILDWNYKIRNLVDESYGCHVDTGIYHLDAACPECRRRFIFHSSEYKSSFRIALNPAIKR